MVTFRSFTKALLGASAGVVLATAAYAADAVVYEQAPEAVEIATGYNWSGFYAGLHAGYAWADRDWDPDGDDDGDAFEYDMRGALAGAQIGYNWQINNFVFGVEADAAWSDARDTVTELGGLIVAEAEMRWLATVRGRAGLAWDRFMIYGTGGVAFAGVDTDVDGAFFIGDDSASATHTGWAAGIGVEAMVTEKISLKAEYLHADFDDEDFDYDLFGGSGNDVFGSADLDVDLIRIGVNFHF